MSKVLSYVLDFRLVRQIQHTAIDVTCRTQSIDFFPAQEPPQGIWDHAGLKEVVAFVERAVEVGQLKPDPLVPIQVEPSKEAFEQVFARWRGIYQ